MQRTLRARVVGLDERSRARRRSHVALTARRRCCRRPPALRTRAATIATSATSPPARASGFGDCHPGRIVDATATPSDANVSGSREDQRRYDRSRARVKRSTSPSSAPNGRDRRSRRQGWPRRTTCTPTRRSCRRRCSPTQHYISPLNPGGNVPAISHWFVCYHLDERPTDGRPRWCHQGRSTPPSTALP